MAQLIGDLKQEAANQLRGLSYVFEVAVEKSFGAISDELQKQIEENVYGKWPEAPKDYERRYDNRGIIDMRRYFTMSELSSERGGPNLPVSVSYEFDYEPDGFQKQWEFPAQDGNELIHRIESGTGYEWKTYDPPQRPFWWPFISSWYQSGAVSNALDGALSTLLAGNGYEGPINIQYQHGDGDYSY